MKKFLIIAGFSIIGVFALFFGVYAIWPQFERTSVPLPAACDGAYLSAEPAGALAYALPGNQGTGILVAKGEDTAVVAMVASTAPHASAIYVVDTKVNQIMRVLQFPNDAIMAAIDGGIVYLYNDKIGYFLYAQTGAPENTLVRIDNYGGLSPSDRPVLMQASGNKWYVETSAIISSWDADGSVRSLLRLNMNAVARGCFINGTTGEVTRL
jgi:hypothetical protein